MSDGTPVRGLPVTPRLLVETSSALKTSVDAAALPRHYVEFPQGVRSRAAFPTPIFSPTFVAYARIEGETALLHSISRLAASTVSSRQNSHANVISNRFGM